MCLDDLPEEYSSENDNLFEKKKTHKQLKTENVHPSKVEQSTRIKLKRLPRVKAMPVVSKDNSSGESIESSSQNSSVEYDEQSNTNAESVLGFDETEKKIAEAVFTARQLQVARQKRLGHSSRESLRVHDGQESLFVHTHPNMLQEGKHHDFGPEHAVQLHSDSANDLLDHGHNFGHIQPKYWTNHSGYSEASIRHTKGNHSDQIQPEQLAHPLHITSKGDSQATHLPIPGTQVITELRFDKDSILENEIDNQYVISKSRDRSTAINSTSPSLPKDTQLGSDARVMQMLEEIHRCSIDQARNNVLRDALQLLLQPGYDTSVIERVRNLVTQEPGGSTEKKQAQLGEDIDKQVPGRSTNDFTNRVSHGAQDDTTQGMNDAQSKFSSSKNKNESKHAISESNMYGSMRVERTSNHEPTGFSGTQDQLQGVFQNIQENSPRNENHCQHEHDATNSIDHRDILTQVHAHKLDIDTRTEEDKSTTLQDQNKDSTGYSRAYIGSEVRIESCRKCENFQKEILEQKETHSKEISKLKIQHEDRIEV